MPSLVGWSLWSLFTLAWTAALVLPISAPTFGTTEEMRGLVRLLLAKTAHVTVYACWAAFTGWLRAPLRVRLFLLMFLMAHAVGTEWVQTYVPARFGSLRDAALDQAGIFIGVLASFRWWTQPDRRL